MVLETIKAYFESQGKKGIPQWFFLIIIACLFGYILGKPYFDKFTNKNIVTKSYVDSISSLNTKKFAKELSYYEALVKEFNRECLMRENEFKDEIKKFVIAKDAGVESKLAFQLSGLDKKYSETEPLVVSRSITVNENNSSSRSFDDFIINPEINNDEIKVTLDYEKGKIDGTTSATKPTESINDTPIETYNDLPLDKKDSIFIDTTLPEKKKIFLFFNKNK